MLTRLSSPVISVVAREHSELPTPKPVTKVPDKGQRLTDKPMSVVNGAAMLDFTFSPTNPCKLAAACEDGVTRVWTLPEGTGAAAEDYSVDSIASAGGHARVVLLKGHNKKAHLVRFCPISHDVIATASYGKELGCCVFLYSIVCRLLYGRIYM
ncbi:hypothetical protein SARC_12831 [Sphaeroforma arctica JP610]|uniref:Uncharacterized protein n=1 Tax=Sphaeroforma arctica JP610 TaxID=667725 RepID=A0A0L0FCZ0_9EUKA|nr:hypothetical protein SARC_12831 [Sphaeroforma arctica JP610]KNC74629.1 hypothetical protein SARC_12831 [Sphaeroforma arctica JP610]|eukprot:XP_014148531.1 hypothetical protein SARC_12831 [Sphaeroforma arctica JP610]